MLFKDNRLLFVDYRGIASADNVKLVMNPPVKRGPCLRVETEWELKAARAHCVVRWQDKWRLYYRSAREDGTPAPAMAESSDGVTWTRPELDLVPFGKSKHTNLLQADDPIPKEFCVFVDPAAPDDERFKLVGHLPEAGGMFAMSSPDGLRFKRIPGMLLRYKVDNNKAAFYDERIGKYVIYLRGWDRSRPIPPMGASRSILRAETDDLHRPIPVDENAPDPWPLKQSRKHADDGLHRPMNKELPQVLGCDELDPPEADLYQAAAVHYLPDVYLSFPSLYFRYPGPPEGFVNDGVLDLQFAASRDGINWRRDFRGPYVRQDLPDGPCTKFMHMMTGMIPKGCRISQFYIGHRHSHGEGRIAVDTKVQHEPAVIGRPFLHRLEQRLDGFVSADSAYTGGTLITTPFVIESETIRLNIDTSASGVAKAALLDEAGKTIPGFALEDSDRVQGNDTQYEVTWKGSSGVSRVKGKRVRLQLWSRSAKLFAIYP